MEQQTAPTTPEDDDALRTRPRPLTKFPSENEQSERVSIQNPDLAEFLKTPASAHLDMIPIPS